MNLAAKEFVEISLDWASAKLSRLAKDHGGPEQLIADIYENGYIDGYSDAMRGEKMKQYGILGVSAAALVGLGGFAFYLYKKNKDKQAELEKEVEENARLKAELYAKELLLSENIQTENELNSNVINVDFRKQA